MDTIAVLHKVIHIAHCTAGDKGVNGDLSSQSIQGLPANVLLAAKTWSVQIWISG